MYIWSIECEVKWNYQGKEEDGEREDYVVSARDYAEAIVKVQKIALAKSRAISEKKEDGTTEKCYPVQVSDFVKIERGDWIDG